MPQLLCWKDVDEFGRYMNGEGGPHSDTQPICATHIR